jgi:hypothetical protein
MRNLNQCVGFVSIFFSLSSFAADKKNIPEGWKTLKNVNGWSISYPKDWAPDGDGGFAPTMEADNFQLLGPGPAGEENISKHCMIFFDTDERFLKSMLRRDPKEYLEHKAKYNSNYVGNSVSLENGRDIKVDGQKAYDEIVVTSGPKIKKRIYERWVYISKDGIFELRLNHPHGIVDNECDDLYAQILETFHFTKGYKRKLR